MRCDTSRPPTRAIADGARSDGRVECSSFADLRDWISGCAIGASGNGSRGSIGRLEEGRDRGAIRWREVYLEIVDSDKMWYRAILGSFLLSVLGLGLDRTSSSVLCLDWDAAARARRLG